MNSLQARLDAYKIFRNRSRRKKSRASHRQVVSIKSLRQREKADITEKVYQSRGEAVDKIVHLQMPMKKLRWSFIVFAMLIGIVVLGLEYPWISGWGSTEYRVETILNRLRDEKAISQLSRIGEPAVPTLIKALRHPRQHIRLKADFALVRIGKPAVPMLIETLGDKNVDLRRKAAFILGNIGEPAVSGLTRALKDEAKTVRLGAAYALGRMGQHAHVAVPALIGALKDESVSVRREVVWALKQIGGPEAINAVKAFERAS